MPPIAAEHHDLTSCCIKRPVPSAIMLTHLVRSGQCRPRCDELFLHTLMEIWPAQMALVPHEPYDGLAAPLPSVSLSGSPGHCLVFWGIGAKPGDLPRIEPDAG